MNSSSMMTRRSEFEGKLTIVTGASGALGRAVVRRLAAQGSRLALLGRDELGLKQLAALQPVPTAAFRADLRDPTQVVRAVNAAVAHFGRLDIVCHLAGAFEMGAAVHTTSDQTWGAMLELNANGLFHVARAVVPTMLTQGCGKFVTVGALAAQKGAAHMGAYVASKSVVSRLTESLAAELRDRGINVNCVLPSVINTPTNRASMPDMDPALWVSPNDVASVILFLASEEARAIHGASIPVSGLS